MTEQEIKEKIIDEIMQLYYSGYDGPFMGDDIQNLYSLLINLDLARRKK